MFQSYARFVRTTIKKKKRENFPSVTRTWEGPYHLQETDSSFGACYTRQQWRSYTSILRDSWRFQSIQFCSFYMLLVNLLRYFFFKILASLSSFFPWTLRSLPNSLTSVLSWLVQEILMPFFHHFNSLLLFWSFFWGSL